MGEQKDKFINALWEIPRVNQSIQAHAAINPYNNHDNDNPTYVGTMII